jgi:hypothetical protein
VTVSIDQIEQVVDILGSTPPNTTCWSRAGMAPRPGSAKLTVGQIRRAFRTKPPLVEDLTLPTDPLPINKMYVIVGL